MLIDLFLFVQRLGDVIGSFLAISEVIFVILDVVLDILFKVGKQFAEHILKKRIIELARVTNR